MPGSLGVPGGSILPSHWEDPSYFSEPEFDSEFQHQHIHKSKESWRVKALTITLAGALEVSVSGSALEPPWAPRTGPEELGADARVTNLADTPSVVIINPLYCYITSSSTRDLVPPQSSLFTHYTRDIYHHFIASTGHQFAILQWILRWELSLAKESRLFHEVIHLHLQQCFSMTIQGLCPKWRLQVLDFVEEVNNEAVCRSYELPVRLWNDH